MTSHDDLSTLAAQVGRLLLARGWTISTAESCTGGLIGHYLTEISGSSAYFMGGIISYDNRIKQKTLGVPEELMIEHGAVSPEVARAMAQRVRELLDTEVGISATGIAGPTGGTPTKPVGTVYLAVATPERSQVAHHVWPEDRSGNKRLSAEAALRLIMALVGQPNT